MNKFDVDDMNIKAEIDAIMESVDQVIKRLEKHGLLNKDSKESPESGGRLLTDAGAGTAAE